MELIYGQLAVAELPGSALAERTFGVMSRRELVLQALDVCCFAPMDYPAASNAAGWPARRNSAAEARALAALLPAGLATRLLDRRARAGAPAIDRKLVLPPKHQ